MIFPQVNILKHRVESHSNIMRKAENSAKVTSLGESSGVIIKNTNT